MRRGPQLLLEGVRNHVLHVRQFLLQVLELSVIARDGLLIGGVLAHQRLFLDLHLFELFSELARERLELLPVVDVLLQLVANQLAVLLRDLLLLQQLPFELP